jgi:hypothetical protein
MKDQPGATRIDKALSGGRRSANPALATRILIGINLTVWLAIVATGWEASHRCE